ncbi:MAG TPA: hypothetical protein VFV07_05995 [Rhizomicrobium sp.]|nr:hypothetical protein [Rhizomicrobium sp.]
MSEENKAPLVSPRVAIGLVAVSVLSLLAFFVFSAYAPEFRDDNDSDTHVLSRSAIGFAGLRILLNADGVNNVIDRGPAPRDVAHNSLTIATPPGDAGDDALANLVKTSGDTRQWLVILPKWYPVNDPDVPGHVLKESMFDRAGVERLLKALSATTKIARLKGMSAPQLTATASAFGPFPDNLGKTDSLQTISGGDWLPLIASRGGGAVLAKLNNYPIYVLADPDLMNTHGLNDLPTAELAVSTIENLRSGSAPVHFDVTLNGLGTTPSLLRQMFAPPFLGATLCAIFAALLMGFHAAVRFGTPPVPLAAFARGKTALVNNAADMIRMLHREPRMAARYAQTTRNLALRALGVRRPLDADDSEALFKDLERQDQLSYSALMQETQQVTNRAEVVTLARRFYEWRQGMFHAN